MSEKKFLPKNISLLQHILLISLILLLPGSRWSIFSWLHGFIPLFIFYFLLRYEKATARTIILGGVTLAGIGAIVSGTFDLYLFSVTFLPAGYVLAQSAIGSESVSYSAFKGSLALGAGWLCYALYVLTTNDLSLYGAFIDSFNQGVEETLRHYRQNQSISTESLLFVEENLQWMKVWFPKLLPSLLGCTFLFNIWFTMAIGNRLLYFHYKSSPWPEIRQWQLPDRFIWFLIVAVTLAMLPVGTTRILGFNLVIVAAVIYSLQGFSILLSFFDKWKLPLMFRVVVFIILLMQSPLLALSLIGLGVSDIWVDYRKIRISAEDITED